MPTEEEVIERVREIDKGILVLDARVEQVKKLSQILSEDEKIEKVIEGAGTIEDSNISGGGILTATNTRIVSIMKDSATEYFYNEIKSFGVGKGRFSYEIIIHPKKETSKSDLSFSCTYNEKGENFADYIKMEHGIAEQPTKKLRTGRHLAEPCYFSFSVFSFWLFLLIHIQESPHLL